MTQQSKVFSRLKRWVGSNKEATIEEDSRGVESLTSDSQTLVNQQGLSKKEKVEQLQKLAGEQSELIGELNEKLVETEIKLKGCNLQSQHLGAQNIVKAHMASGGALALLPIPVFDFASLAGTQLSLVRKLAHHYGVTFDEGRARTLLMSLLSGAIPLVAVVGLSSVAKVIPGIGSIGGGISMSMMSGALVYAVGQVFIKHFDQGGTLDDFQSSDWTAFFKKKFEEKRALKQ